MYPRRLLHEGEEVVFDLRPHPIRLVRPVVGAAVVVGAAAYGFVAWSSAPQWFGIVVGVPAALALAVLVARVIAWRATLLVLTTSRVIYRTGVLRRVGREIPIDRVQDVTYVQRLGERIVGAGTVTVESAGERGSEPFPDVRRPEWVQSTINAVIDESRHDRGRDVVAPTDGRQTPGAEIEELTALHRHGVITDAEYAAKRQELLDRL